mmetsp:Transcript_8157/g.24830  ORF Transcript_8157/g.24830 Transcript_8157/m.24830 type:complete len:110 (-) Transcript_8157:57-386(-)
MICRTVHMASLTRGACYFMKSMMDKQGPSTTVKKLPGGALIYGECVDDPKWHHKKHKEKTCAYYKNPKHKIKCTQKGPVGYKGNNGKDMKAQEACCECPEDKPHPDAIG